VADAVAEVIRGSIGGVLAEFDSVGGDVVVDLGAPDRVERADEGQRALADLDF